MYIIRAEQADALNYCNLQGSNSSPKYISPYCRKTVQITSNTRESKLIGSQETADVLNITASMCCKSEWLQLCYFTSLHINSQWPGWINCTRARKQPRAAPRKNCKAWGSLPYMAFAATQCCNLLSCGQNDVHVCFYSCSLMIHFMLIIFFHTADSKVSHCDD